MTGQQPTGQQARPSAIPARTGCIFILSAPSGAGKSTLCQALRRHFPWLAYSVSYTTRPPRTGERHGRDYYFISRTEFKEGIEQRRWAEWAQVHGQYYGTSASWITATLESGKDILMDIDVQGARQIVQRFPQAITIFVLPPSMEVLAERLRRRGTDDPSAVAERLENGRQEIAQKDSYRYRIINDDLADATQQLIRIIESHGHATPQE